MPVCPHGEDYKTMSLFTVHNAAAFITIVGLCLYTISTLRYERAAYRYERE
jgi:hypothetical protein